MHPRPLLTSVFLKSLRDQLVAIAAWGGGIAVLAYVTLLAFPAMTSLAYLNQLLDQFPQLRSFMGDVTSFTSLEGYVTSGLLIYMPLVLAVYAIQLAVGMVSDEITTGTMDFLLEHPIPRWRAVLEKYAALAVALLAIGMLTGLALWLAGVSIASDVSLARWLLAGLNIVPLTLLFGSLAFALACAVRGRGIPIGVAATVAVGGFILSGLAPLVSGLQPYREWTIYYLFAVSKPLTEGIDLGATGILLGACALCLLFAIGAFTRRDILA